jgi:hypothetical protein
MTTYTTVGYGDLHAESPAEMIFSMIYMFWNIGLTAYVLGHFGKLVVENIRTVSNLFCKINVQYVCDVLRKELMVLFVTVTDFLIHYW